MATQKRFNSDPQPVTKIALSSHGIKPCCNMQPSCVSFGQVPQVSAVSTSDALSDARFSYFARVAAADTHQAETIVALLRRFRWTYVSLVYSAGSYGVGGATRIKKLAKKFGICIAQSAIIRLVHSFIILVRKCVFNPDPNPQYALSCHDDEHSTCQCAQIAPQNRKTRSSAQGNCNTKSLAVSVISSFLPCLSILPCPPCLPPVMLSASRVQLLGGLAVGGLGREGVGGGEGVWGEGAGDISSPLPYTALPHGASP